MWAVLGFWWNWEEGGGSPILSLLSSFFILSLAHPSVPSIRRSTGERSIWDQLWGIQPQTVTGNEIRGESMCSLLCGRWGGRLKKKKKTTIESLIWVGSLNGMSALINQFSVFSEGSTNHFMSSTARHPHPGMYLSSFYSYANISDGNFQDIRMSYE